MYDQAMTSSATVLLGLMHDIKTVQMSKIYMAAASSATLVQVIKQHVVAAASRAAVSAGKYKKHFPVVVIDLPCTFFSLQTSDLPAASIVARNMKFTPLVQQLAALVLGRIWLEANEPSKKLFNGMDLWLQGRTSVPQQRGVLGGDIPLLRKYLQVSRVHYGNVLCFHARNWSSSACLLWCGGG
jgi:hypothetical protein